LATALGALRQICELCLERCNRRWKARDLYEDLQNTLEARSLQMDDNRLTCHPSNGAIGLYLDHLRGSAFTL